MTPSAEPASGRITAAAQLVPADLLQNGEIFVLVIKPSMWFVPVASLPTVAVAAAAAAGAYLLDVYQPAVPVRTILPLCLLAATVRLLLACWQWLGRTYVLTNRRVACVRGLVNPQTTAAVLADIGSAELAAALPERLVAVASIYCTVESEPAPAVVWNCLARPQEVHELVCETIDRARRANRAARRHQNSTHAES